MSSPAQAVTIDVDTQQVSGLLQLPDNARAAYVMAHGAGAGMTHPFLQQMADGLAQQGIASLRYQFPYMQAGSKRPDSPKVAHAAVRAAVATAARLLPDLPLIAGGKSFGARMTSQAQAEDPLPRVVGLAFIGFPLHPAGKPSDERAKHLGSVRIPMLFLQGTNDKLADLSLLQPVIASLGQLASLQQFEAADHSFHVPVRSGRSDAELRSALVLALTRWIDAVSGAR